MDYTTVSAGTCQSRDILSIGKARSVFCHIIIYINVVYFELRNV